MTTERLIKITLDEGSILRWNADIDHERRVAIFDLLEQNSFEPADDVQGPYCLHLGIVENRLVFDLSSEAEEPLCKIVLPTSPFRRTIRDYFQICESYFTAIKTASPSRIEAIDMGRRGVHNEGSTLLQERLQGKAAIDFDTARRLFTLICVLHLRG